ncbi:MAG: ATP-binding protein [Acidobacteriota bacterium]|jgi:PAS domain S-box-containing protein
MAMREARRSRPAEEREDETPGRFLPEVMDSLSDAVIVASIADHTVEYVNRSLIDTLGYLPDDLVGASIITLYPDEDAAQAFRDAVDEALRTGTAGFRSEQVFVRKDGDRTWAEMTTRLVPSEDPEKLVCVLRDITERKLWEDALVQSHARLELLNSILSGVKLGMSVEAVIDLALRRLGDHFPGIRVAYGVVDDAGVLEVTQEIHPDGMRSLAGVTVDLNQWPSYLSALRASEAFVVSDVEREDASYREILNEDTRAALHVPMEYADGAALLCLESPMPVSWSMHAITTVTEVASHLSFVLKDAQASRTRRQLEEQLRQSQKMEAVGRLAGGVAHDFNNILTGITGYVELVLAEIDEPQARRDLEQVRQFSDRAAGLTHQLLAFSRRQPLTVSIVDLNELVGATTDLIERLIGEDVELTFSPGVDLAAVKADAGQIEQVLMNLAVNSRDAMPDGGRLTIETSNHHLDQDYARRHTAVTPGDYVVLSVSDTGIGMDEETRARIFEPFYTTKEQGKGTGLGLSTVYGIVKQHDGNVWVYSEPGRGTCFKIYLPVAQGEPKAVAHGEESMPAADGDETILLVEDEPRVRDAVQRALESFGYTVLAATHPDEATTLFAANDASIDLLLSDVVMPGCDGIELHRRLCGRRSDLPVLFMSGYTDRSILEEGVLAPGVPFIQKPFSPAQLVCKVRAVLDETGS